MSDCYNGGLNVCQHDTDVLSESESESEWTRCGSNYDGFGNVRFIDPKLMLAPEYIVESIFWRHLKNCDAVFMVFLTVYELVTEYALYDARYVWSINHHLFYDYYFG